MRHHSICILVILALSGCVNLDLGKIAPIPSAEAGPQLARGRLLYVTKCAKCHAPEPVAKYSISEWQDILPDMVEESKLGEADAEALRRYVALTTR
jgi:mono/diheme cytochrome c family protein